MDVPKDRSQKDYEIIQFSKYDPIEMLFDRVEKSRESSDFKLWRVYDPNIPFSDYQNNLKNQYK